MAIVKAQWLSAFQHRNFRLVWTGQVTSQVGSAGHTIAVSFFIKEAFQSGTIVGSVAFFSGLASILCLPLSGVLADRHNRRTIILICDALNAFSALILGLMFLVLPSGSMSLAYAAVLCTFLVRLTSTFFRPAFGATLPDLVPRAVLSQANAVYKAGARGGDLARQALGGFVYRWLGPGTLFLLDALSYFVALWCVFRTKPASLFVPKSTSGSPENEGVIREFMQGVRAITKIPGGAIFLSMALLINFFATPIFVLMPFHVTDYLQGDAATLGVIVGALSAGVLAGYALAARWSIAKGGSTVILTTIVVMSAFFIIFSISRNFIISCTSLFLAGVANGYWSIYFETTLQRMVRREALGRVYACFGLLSAGLTPAAALAGGLALDLLNQRTTILFLVCSILMTLYPLTLFFNQKFLSFFDRLADVNSD